MLLLALIGVSSSARAQHYSVSELPPVTGETSEPIATAINASGVIVGILGVNPYESPWVAPSSDPFFNWPNGGVAFSMFQYSGTTSDVGSSIPNYCQGPTSSIALAINASGQITGSTSCELAFLYQPGKNGGNGAFALIPKPADALASWGQGINANGQVVGTLLISGGPGAGCSGNGYHSFLYDPDTNITSDLGSQLGCSSHGAAINDSGEIAGTFTSTDGIPRGYVWSNGTATDIGNTARCANAAIAPSYALAINSSGQVTGSAWDGCGGNGADAFVYDSSTGTIQDIGNLGAHIGSQGNAINSSGQIVGVSYTSSAALHAFLYSNGAMVDLNSLVSSADAAQYTLVSAVAINDSGQIVVLATKISTAQPVTLLLTPVASVPYVVGDTQAAATSALTTAGFVLGVVTTQDSTVVAPGLVISEDPGAGTSATAGSAVNLVVSSGVTVPNVVGVSLATASNDLASAGLATGSITQQYSGATPQGTVIAESPAAGSAAAGGTPVSLVISSGVAPTEVPNVLGDTQAAATAALDSASLSLGTVGQQASGTVPLGEVLSQSPAEGDLVAAGSAVNLILSSGPPHASIGLAGPPQFTYNGSGWWAVAVGLRNNGNVTVNVTLLSASLNSVSSPSADGLTLAEVSPGATGYVMLTLPVTVTSGALKLSGSYAAGTLSGNWNIGARVSVPPLP